MFRAIEAAIVRKEFAISTPSLSLYFIAENIYPATLDASTESIGDIPIGSCKLFIFVLKFHKNFLNFN